MSREKGGDRPMSVIEHLAELRARILLSILIIVLFSSGAFMFVPRLMPLISRLVGQLYFMAPAEAFWVQLKLSLFIGLYLSLPFVLYQIWRFVELGLYQGEKKLLLPLTLLSFMLFTAGAAFCYILVIPAAVRFFLSYASASLVPLISVSRYLSFIGYMMIAFGLTFQLPLALSLLARIGLVNSSKLRHWRRYAILLSFVAAAALTPTPDMVNQTLLALPMILLYEASIWMICLMRR